MNKFCLFLLLFQLINCSNTPKKESKHIKLNIIKKQIQKKEAKIDLDLILNKDNSIPFLMRYGIENTEKKIRILTKFGDIDIELFENTPYHRANFIYLTKKKYFNNTFFHRVVKGFIIQGGNSDNINTSKKRASIGKYLLPPDSKKDYKHHRGVISMPSSEIKNPHKLASPFEFFIVIQAPGAYHLDGHYTAFGKVINGLAVIDEISIQATDNREAPIENIILKIEIIN